jgi:hypothetical protein
MAKGDEFNPGDRVKWLEAGGGTNTRFGTVQFSNTQAGLPVGQMIVKPGDGTGANVLLDEATTEYLEREIDPKKPSEFSVLTGEARRSYCAPCPPPTFGALWSKWMATVPEWAVGAVVIAVIAGTGLVTGAAVHLLVGR